VATTLAHLNACPASEFVALVGPVFEHSPWIAEAAERSRPFSSREALHALMCFLVRTAPREKQLALIRAHPDLVGRAALTAESTREQAAAGLMQLSAEERAQFDRYNREYQEKFGFPFVICARRNDKEKILSAFSVRIFHTVDEEMPAALQEIYLIANLRLLDLIPEPATL
jgi:2-oxo-4-hydroxy-4-carboxy-5-ureidoimidazoline decarboxylase